MSNLKEAQYQNQKIEKTSSPKTLHKDKLLPLFDLAWDVWFSKLNSAESLRAPRCNEYGGNFLAKRKPGSCHRGSLLPHGLLSTTRLRPWKKANQTRFKIPFKQTICSLVLDVE